MSAFSNISTFYFLDIQHDSRVRCCNKPSRVLDNRLIARKTRKMVETYQLFIGMRWFLTHPLQETPPHKRYFRDNITLKWEITMNIGEPNRWSFKDSFAFDHLDHLHWSLHTWVRWWREFWYVYLAVISLGASFKTEALKLEFPLGSLERYDMFVIIVIVIY